MEALLRPITDSDEELLLTMFKTCSYDTLFYRFMSSSLYIHLQKGNTQSVKKMIKRFCCIDHRNCMSIVAIVTENGKEKIVSWGLYVITSAKRAEIAIMTEDNWQMQGLATKIGEFLIDIAKSRGIKFFEGEILLSNHKLFNLMKTLKINFTRVIKHGSLHFEIDLDNPFLK
ncbi:MAG: GNAT family N-acetyltransferase [Candidatus Helarchaeota archaeon]